MSLVLAQTVELCVEQACEGIASCRWLVATLMIEIQENGAYGQAEAIRPRTPASWRHLTMHTILIQYSAMQACREAFLWKLIV